MNLLLVVGVLPLGLQVTAARRISTAPGRVREAEREVLRVTWWVAGVLGAGLLVLTPVVDLLLRLHDAPTAALLGLTLEMTGGFETFLVACSAAVFTGSLMFLLLGGNMEADPNKAA